MCVWPMSYTSQCGGYSCISGVCVGHQCGGYSCISGVCVGHIHLSVEVIVVLVVYV